MLLLRMVSKRLGRVATCGVVVTLELAATRGMVTGLHDLVQKFLHCWHGDLCLNLDLGR